MAAQRKSRQLRADDTRARLFAAAGELFSAHGYHDTTVDAIARRAGVAKGTFFVHFATKDAVIGELIGVQTRAAKRARTAALADGKGHLAALRATVLALGAQAGLSRELSRAVLAATLDNAAVSGEASALFHDVFASMIDDARAAIGTGELARGGDPSLLAQALMASYLGAAFHFASTRGSPPLLTVLAPLVEANIAGFRIEEGPHAQPRTHHRSRRRSDRRRR
jgi:AcrR family transcriptional regulator